MRDEQLITTNPVIVMLRSKKTRTRLLIAAATGLAVQILAASALPGGAFGPVPWFMVLLPPLLWIAAIVFGIVLAVHQIVVAKTVPWLVYASIIVCTGGVIISFNMANSYAAAV